MARDADTAGRVPRIRGLQVVSGTLLERLLIRALDHDQVEVDARDDQLGVRGAAERRRGARWWCLRRVFRVDDVRERLLQVALSSLGGEPGPPQQPADVPAQSGRDHQARDAEPLEDQRGERPAGPRRHRLRAGEGRLGVHDAASVPSVGSSLNGPRPGRSSEPPTIGS